MESEFHFKNFHILKFIMKIFRFRISFQKFSKSESNSKLFVQGVIMHKYHSTYLRSYRYLAQTANIRRTLQIFKTDWKHLTHTTNIQYTQQIFETHCKYLTGILNWQVQTSLRMDNHWNLCQFFEFQLYYFKNWEIREPLYRN